MKTQLISSLVSIVFMAASALAACPEGDLNRDCKVDLSDFAMMAENWLNIEPNLPFGSVIINELRAHSHDIAPDWIELYNTTGSVIDIGGWHLSDNDNELTSINSYEIPGGTTIPAYGYIVFYENTSFGTKFGLSERGDDIYLSLHRGAEIFGMDDWKFGASEVNVPFGRYTTSIGDVKFVAMDSDTPGQLNSYPKIGPIVITEVMYYFDTENPDDDDYEYVELYNIEDHAVDLWIYDPCTAGAVSWAITKGITYTFPPDTTIPAHGYLLVVKDKVAFSPLFPDVPSSIIFGPFSGKLSNEGENVELSMPGELDEFGARDYIRIDNVSYSDGKHHENFAGLDPWRYTSMANGKGQSLQKINPNLFGDDVNNWMASEAAPGE